MQLSLIYNRSQLETRVFLGAFNAMMASIGAKVFGTFAKDPKMAFACLTSLHKVAYFDLGIITDGMIADRERTIMMQQEAIRELSTPTLQVRDRQGRTPIARASSPRASWARSAPTGPEWW